MVEEKEKPKEKEMKDEKTPAVDAKQKDGKEMDKDGKCPVSPLPAKSPIDNEQKDDGKGGRKKLLRGMVIKTMKNAFKVEGLITNGRYGDIYKVSLVDKPTIMMALKTEVDEEGKPKLDRMKFETCALDLLMRRGLNGFQKLFDRGTTTQFRFIVTTLVGPSLRTIQTEICKGPFPDDNAIYLMCVTMETIHSMHKVGLIHRNIKPHNFYAGHGKWERGIYLLDFSICRKYEDDNGVFMTPRSKVPFLGTLKYASRRCQAKKEPTLRDDYESWAFMVLEFFMDLPWQEKKEPNKDRQDIYNMKSVLFKQAKGGHSPMSFKPIPGVTNKEFYAQILQEIDKMSIVDDLDKTRIREIVEGVLKDMGKKARETHNFAPKDPKEEFVLPLVWEGKVIPDKAPKKKSTDKKKDEEGKEDDEARKEKLAKIKKMEKEISKVMRELDEIQEEKKERSRSDRGRRRSGGRKKKGPNNDDDDDYDDICDNEDDDESYEDERDRKKQPPSVARKARSQDKKDRKRASKDFKSLKRDTKRRTHTRTDVSKMVDVPNDENGRGKGPSAEKIDEKDGGRKEAGKKTDKEVGTPGGSKERLDSKENIGTDSKEKIGEGSKEKMSAEQIPAASPIK